MKKESKVHSEHRESDDESPRPNSSARRHSVFGPPYDPKTDKSSPSEVHPKTTAEIKKLKAALSTVPILVGMTDDSIHQIIMAMEHRTVQANQVIIQEGDVGDYFYVIESGKYEASHKVKTKNVSVTKYNEGGYFGELSLLYNQPRSATVTAMTDGKLWALSQRNFKKTVALSDRARREKYDRLIAKVEILNNLSEDERHRLGESLISKTFEKGQLIIKQGDQADGMYFIEAGQVSIKTSSTEGQNDIKISTLKAGDYFGELALLTHNTRAATVEAETDVTVAFLNIDSFERLLGNCDTIMRRNVKTYEKQMKKLRSQSQSWVFRK